MPLRKSFFSPLAVRKMKGIRECRLRLQGLQHPVAVQFWHHDVAQDQVGPIPTRRLDTLTAICGCDWFVIVIAEDRGELSAHLWLIFNDQYLFMIPLERREA